MKFPAAILEELRTRRTLLTINEVADIIGFNFQVVHRWARKGTIPHFRIAGRLRFDGHQVAAWIEQGGVG